MQDKLDQLISELDTAVGMLIVTSATNSTVKEAMKLISKVSIELSDIINSMEDNK